MRPGDFNAIRLPSEHNRFGSFSKSMRDFSEFIEDLELKDPLVQGGYFTWL